MLQWPWVFLNCFNAHLLSFKRLGIRKIGCRPNMHYLVSHLLRYILIGDRLQHVRLLKCSLHISCVLNWTGTSPQLPWFYLNTHALCFILIRKILQHAWIFLSSFNTHLLCFEKIRDTLKGIWFYAHCLNTLPLGLKVIKNLSYLAHGKFIQGHILFEFRPGWGSNFMDRDNDTMQRSLQSGHLSMQKPIKN